MSGHTTRPATNLLLVAGRQHAQRDLWLVVGGTLLLGGIGLSLAILAVEFGARKVGFWPHAGEFGGIVLSVLAIYIFLALLIGWPLPGGFVAQSAGAGPEPPPPGKRKDRLLPGERLSPDESLWSPDGTVRLTMQSDGNLVVYSGLARWDTATAGIGDSNYLELLEDGNIFLRSGDGKVLIDWRAAGMGGKRLVLQDDGNLCLQSDGGVVWASDRLKDGSFVIVYDPVIRERRAHPKRLF